MSEVQDTKFIPRPYQVVIAGKAMKENTIIFLPTGSGKTFISLLAIKHFLSQETRAFEEGGKICVFVVNAVVLVDQQARVLERHLPISKAGKYSGKLNVDSWNRGKWQEEFKKHKVLVLCEEGEILLSEAITIPKALADVFEALAGAIFFDSGRDLNAVWNVFYPLMHDVIQSCNKVPIEPVRELHEMFPGVKFEYNHDDKHIRIIATCRVELGGKVQKFHGYGENKKMAKRAAAKFALYTLKKRLQAR